MKKQITIKQLARIIKEGTAPDAAVDPTAAPAADMAAPAAVDPSIVALVQQLATACGLQVTDPNAAAPAAEPAAEPAPAAVAERRRRLAKIREARRRAALRAKRLRK